jgi:hypothetical protein
MAGRQVQEAIKPYPTSRNNEIGLPATGEKLAGKAGR